MDRRGRSASVTRSASASSTAKRSVHSPSKVSAHGLSAVLLATLDTGQAFLVSPSQVVTLGVDGDTFGIDHFAGDSAVILIRPKGESCTLRFPLSIGESLFIRTSDSDGRSMLCEAKLISIMQDQAAQFSAGCGPQVTSEDRKCPA